MTRRWGWGHTSEQRHSIIEVAVLYLASTCVLKEAYFGDEQPRVFRRGKENGSLVA